MLYFSTHFHSPSQLITLLINYLFSTSNITWNVPCSVSQGHELSDDSTQPEELHTAADPKRKNRRRVGHPNYSC